MPIRPSDERFSHQVEPPESLTFQILQAVATVTNKPMTGLPPLFDDIDPEALETLFSSSPDGPDRAEGSVTFQYAGVRVSVSADGSITVDHDPIEQAE